MKRSEEVRPSHIIHLYVYVIRLSIYNKTLPLCTVLQGGMKLFEAVAGDVAEELSELGLPLIAVLRQRGLERRAVQRHKLDVQYRLFLLDTFVLLCVPDEEETQQGKGEEYIQDVQGSVCSTKRVFCECVLSQDDNL